MRNGAMAILEARRWRALLAILGFAVLLMGEASAAQLSADQLAAYRAALAAADKGDWSQARAQAAKARHPLADKLVRWHEYRTPSSGALFEEIVGFVEANPNWPGQRSLRQRAEESIGPGVPDDAVLAWFARNPPRTSDGAQRYAEALQRAGDEAKAIQVVRQAWAGLAFPGKRDEVFAQSFGAWLRPEDHWARLDRLVWENNDAGARGQMRFVDQGRRALAETRLRLRSQDTTVERFAALVPDSLRGDPGLLYERARWHRQKGNDESARAILIDSPTDLGRPDLWWNERSIQARRALFAGLVTDAYKIAAQHGAADGVAMAEGEWLAGWIALRFLNEPDTALRHFEAMGQRVQTKVSRARAHYWRGRAAEATGHAEQARQAYGEAARHPLFYYGQLAATRMGAMNVTIADPAPGAKEIAAFEASELVRVIRIAAELGRKDLVDAFLERLDETATSAAEQALAISLAHEVARPDQAVRLARRAKRDDATFLALGYPVLTVPGGPGPEMALVLALIRQESAFNAQAVSTAGARGLMQLMPATAKKVSKDLNLRFSEGKLTQDPFYNMTLGRHYLDQQLADFSGSYVLAAAAYNAGPGRVRQWLKTIGDPRLSETDVIDWVEMIPFNETRDYVQRVIEGLQAYRWRLGEAQRVALIEHDLKRGRGNPPPTLACQPPATANC